MTTEVPFSIPVDSLIKHTSNGHLPEGFIERLQQGEVNQADILFLFAMVQTYVDYVTKSPEHRGLYVSRIRNPHQGIEKIRVILSRD